jgi:hypothetical protein
VIARTDAGWAIPGNRWDLLDGVIADPPPSVSVVVVHYDQPRQLERTLHALARRMIRRSWSKSLWWMMAHPCRPLCRTVSA